MMGPKGQYGDVFCVCIYKVSARTGTAVYIAVCVLLFFNFVRAHAFLFCCVLFCCVVFCLLRCIVFIHGN